MVNKIYVFLIAVIISVLPFMDRTDCFCEIFPIAILVPLSVVILCVNEFRSITFFRLNLTDIAVLLFCIYVLIRDIQSTGLKAERSLQFSLLALLYLIVKTDEKNSIKAIAIGILLCGTIQSTIAYMQLLGFLNSNHSAFACTGLFYISLSAMLSSPGAEAPGYHR